jgi:hypothetical protein
VHSLTLESCCLQKESMVNVCKRNVWGT